MKIPFRQLASRITGFTTPAFGLSWTRSHLDVEAARRIVAFLEDRRVLYSPYELEVASHVVQSVQEIRHVLTDAPNELDRASPLAESRAGTVPPPSFAPSGIGRMPAGSSPPLTRLDEEGPIQLQRRHRCTTGRGPAGDAIPSLHPGEMLEPTLFAWIEECGRQPGRRVGRLDAVALEDVALTAGSPEVGTERLPPEGLGQQVLDLQWRAGDFLTGATIPAPAARIGQHLGAQPVPDAGRAHARATRSDTSIPRL